MSTEIMWKPKRNNAHEITQQKQTHRLREPNLQLRGEDGGRKGQSGSLGWACTH